MLQPGFQYSDFISYIFPEYDGSKIKSLTFQITDNCNLCCSYCYQIQKGHHKMPFEIAKKFIDYVFTERTNPKSEFYEGNTTGFVIEFIGGEPLLEIELMDQICEYFEKKLLEVPESIWNLFHTYSISSNGTLYFTKPVQKFLKKYKDLVSIGITVDGNKELHDKCRLFTNGQGSYDLVMAAAQDVIQKFNIRDTKLTFSPQNIKYVYSGFRNMIESGFVDIYGNCVFEDVWHNDEDIKEYYQQLKQLADWVIQDNTLDNIYIRIFDPDNYKSFNTAEGNTQWCGTTTSMYALDYKGDIYSCLRFMESSLGEDAPPLIIGNIDRGIATLDKEKDIIGKFKYYNKNNIYTKQCFECPIENGCSWCAACTYQQTGDLKCRGITTCEIHKAEYLATLYLYKQYDKKIWQSMSKVNYDFVNKIISQEEYNSLIKEG